MKQKFKKGDTVRCIVGGTGGAGWTLGRTFIVSSVHTSPYVKEPCYFAETGNEVWEDSLVLVKNTKVKVEYDDHGYLMEVKDNEI